MIELTITEFFTSLVMVPLVLWLAAGLMRRFLVRRERVAARRAIIRCRYCGTPFSLTGALDVENCPRCQAQNQARRDRRLG